MSEHVDNPNLPAHARIAAHLSAQIRAGELRAGERVPSTRQLVGEWGVAMATATKALSLLKQQGWVRTIPGSATVVQEPAERSTPARTAQRHAGGSGQRAEPGAHRDVVVRAAIVLADTEGRAALSIRRLAAELGIATMSLYRHVPDKDELLRLMSDMALGEEELPEPGPPTWRAKLELAARLQWRAYRRHPWLAPAVLNSLLDPPVIRSGLRLVDWELRALAEFGLSRRTMLYSVVTLNGYVGGIAISNALEVETEQDTGLSAAQRVEADQTMLSGVIDADQLTVLADIPSDNDLEGLFEFGLQRQLDGLEAFLKRT